MWVSLVPIAIHGASGRLSSAPGAPIRSDAGAGVNLNWSGNMDARQLVSAYGIDVNARDTNGMTAFLEAVALGDVGFAEFLLAGKANINAANNEGESALHLASGNTNMVTFLLANGADVNAKTCAGETPLYHATADVAELLIAHGADVNVRNKYGQTPLDAAVCAQQKSMARLFLEKGADVNEPDSNGDTPLFKAVCLHDRDIVALLLAHGADVNHGIPLIQAACQKSTDIAKLLLAHGADVNGVSWCHETALEAAAYFGNKDMVKLLLSHGARVNDADDWRRTPLYYSVESMYPSSPAVMQMLLRHGADLKVNAPQTMILAVVAYHMDALALLLKSGADVNAAGTDRQTPLHKAAFCGLTDAAKVLLKYGADVNARDVRGDTPLHIAAERGNPAVAELLLARGANVNATNSLGNTPLRLIALEERDAPARMPGDTAYTAANNLYNALNKLRGQQAIARLLRQDGGHE